jgi:hypothetical protein
MPNRWKRVDGVLWRGVLDDVVILVRGRPGRAEPFALAGGAQMWHLLVEPRSAGELAQTLWGAGGSNDPAHEAELDSLLVGLADSGAVEQLPA